MTKQLNKNLTLGDFMPIFEFLIGAGVGSQLLKWLGDKYGDDIKNKVKKGFDKFDWSAAQRKYRDKIFKDFGTIKLIGSDEKISLDDIFTDVYLLKESEAFEYHRWLERRRDFSDVDEDKRFEGVEFVKNTSKNLYILGKPGAGKTTFLKHITVQAANNKINKVPVFIYLRDWARKPNVDLFNFIVNEFDICGFPEAKYLIEYLLEVGKLIILLDGLDEVPETENTRRDIIADIKEFTRKYSKNQFLMTCRIASIDYSFENFTYLRIADFTKEQIENYVNNWFKGKSAHKLELFKFGLFKPNNIRFLEMASQPLLLSLLCVNFNETMVFSESRIEIYEEAISFLLQKWNAFNDVTRDEFFKLSKERKMNMFSEIAAQNSEKVTDYDRFPKHILEDQLTTFLSKLPNAPNKEDIDGESVIRNIQSTNGILIERFKNVYSFGHLSFQEYFTARYVRDNNRIKKLLTPDNIIQDKWREIILNTSAILSNADDFFSQFQTSINLLICDSPELKTLIRLANQKTLSEKSNRRVQSVRFFYLVLILFQEFDLELENAIALDLNLSQNWGFAQNLDKTLELALDIALLRNQARLVARNIDNTWGSTSRRVARNRMSIRARNFDIITSLDRIIGDCLENNLALDYQLFILKQTISIYYYLGTLLIKKIKTSNKIDCFLQDTINKGWQLNEKKITGEIEKLTGITKNLTEEKYEGAIETIDKALYLRGVKSNQKIKFHCISKLNEYFQANRLLLECLDLAVVSDRKAIEDKMFLTSE